MPRRAGRSGRAPSPVVRGSRRSAGRSRPAFLDRRAPLLSRSSRIERRGGRLSTTGNRLLTPIARREPPRRDLVAVRGVPELPGCHRPGRSRGTGRVAAQLAGPPSANWRRRSRRKPACPRASDRAYRRASRRPWGQGSSHASPGHTNRFRATATRVPSDPRCFAARANRFRSNAGRLSRHSPIRKEQGRLPRTSPPRSRAAPCSPLPQSSHRLLLRASTIR